MISLKCPDCGFFWKQIYLTTTTSRRIDGMSEWISVKERFPERLRRIRERNRLSRYKLSDLCGISSDQIRRYELGERKPRSDALEAIADYFEVSTDYLLGRTDYPCVVKPLSSHRRI